MELHIRMNFREWRAFYDDDLLFESVWIDGRRGQ